MIVITFTFPCSASSSRFPEQKVLHHEPPAKKSEKETVRCNNHACSDDRCGISWSSFFFVATIPSIFPNLLFPNIHQRVLMVYPCSNLCVCVIYPLIACVCVGRPSVRVRRVLSGMRERMRLRSEGDEPSAESGIGLVSHPISDLSHHSLHTNIRHRDLISSSDQQVHV